MTQFMKTRIEPIAKSLGPDILASCYKSEGARYDVRPYQTTHNVGGAVMGTDPRTSVVNRSLQSWDLHNLFVMAPPPSRRTSRRRAAARDAGRPRAGEGFNKALTEREKTFHVRKGGRRHRLPAGSSLCRAVARRPLSPAPLLSPPAPAAPRRRRTARQAGPRRSTQPCGSGARPNWMSVKAAFSRLVTGPTPPSATVIS
jgi:hypothetical protein